MHHEPVSQTLQAEEDAITRSELLRDDVKRRDEQRTQREKHAERVREAEQKAFEAREIGGSRAQGD